jgi:Zn-dependent protease
MFRFRLGSIPVTVHPSHLLLGALFGIMSLEYSGPTGSWPGDVLGDPSATGQLQTKLAVVLIWMGVVFVSVLFHELGHALTMRAFRYQPSIQLVMFGGYTSPNTDGPLPWWRDVVTTLAGPLFGVTLGVFCRLVIGLHPGDVATYGLRIAETANYFWAAYNMLPIPPLDGGRVSLALLSRAFGKVGAALAHLLALLLCALVAFFFWGRGTFLVFFVALFALQNVQALLAMWRREPQGRVPPDLLQAEALFRAGQLERARLLAERLLTTDVPVSVRSRLQHLLGWVALKEGEGRRALDHFSQVQGRQVERHALAAAFSLIGDDGRALPLWEQAYKETTDPTVLHEWAGALIRSGDERRAAEIPGIDLAAAYACAEKVAFLRGAYSEAARFGEASLAQRPTPDRAYDVACAYARAGDTRRALTLLGRARELGFRDAEAAAGDPDLSSLFGLPEFQGWLTSLRKTAAS